MDHLPLVINTLSERYPEHHFFAMPLPFHPGQYGCLIRHAGLKHAFECDTRDPVYDPRNPEYPLGPAESLLVRFCQEMGAFETPSHWMAL